MCRQRRRTWGKHGPGAVCLPAGNGTAPQPFSCAAGKKSPSKGAGGIRLGTRSSARADAERTRVSTCRRCVATVEDDHFVVVHVGVHQVGAGDMAHVQRAAHALEYQDLADGIFLAHGVDAGSELVLEVGCGCDEVGEHGIAPGAPARLSGGRPGRHAVRTRKAGDVCGSYSPASDRPGNTGASASRMRMRTSALPASSGSVPARPACPCCGAPAEAARRRSLDVLQVLVRGAWRSA